MNYEFWNDVLGNFLANFASDILLGIGLGTFMAFWVGKRLNDLQRSQERREERRAELKKSVRYLELLRSEIAGIYERLPDLVRSFSETGWGREIPLSTPFWDVVQPSGELPILLDPQLVASIAVFYDNISYAKRGRDLVVDSWLASQPRSIPGMDAKLNAFVNMTLEGLRGAVSLGRNLPNALGETIEELRAQLEQYE